MPHLPPAHHETSKHDSPNETEIKEKQNETILDSNSNLIKSMTHHNQTKELPTWFLNSVSEFTENPDLDIEISYYKDKLKEISMEYNSTMICEWPTLREKELYFYR
jgi:hypothetical protein